MRALVMRQREGILWLQAALTLLHDSAASCVASGNATVGNSLSVKSPDSSREFS